jgi:aspartyl-tRNA(Asn)/glutamyl-tRNA(Gln) amidotransferase subunit B
MELGALLKDQQWSHSRVPSDHLAAIIAHLLRKQITGRTAKLLLSVKFEGDTRPVEQIIADEDLLLRPLSRAEYVELASRVMNENPDMVKNVVEKQQHQKVKWFVGQMMARGSEGTVEPGTAEAVLRELLRLAPMEQK